MAVVENETKLDNQIGFLAQNVQTAGRAALKALKFFTGQQTARPARFVSRWELLITSGAASRPRRRRQEAVLERLQGVRKPPVARLVSLTWSEISSQGRSRRMCKSHILAAADKAPGILRKSDDTGSARRTGSGNSKQPDFYMARV